MQTFWFVFKHIINNDILCQNTLFAKTTKELFLFDY